MNEERGNGPVEVDNVGGVSIHPFWHRGVWDHNTTKQWPRRLADHDRLRSLNLRETSRNGPNSCGVRGNWPRDQGILDYT